MPKFSKMSDEDIAILLSTKNNAKVTLTVEEKLDRVFASAAKKRVSIRKFHFNLIENGTKLVLFDGNKTKQGEFPKDRKGLIGARQTARKLFLNSPANYRQGGFTFSCPFVNEFGAIKDEYDQIFNGK